MKKVTPFKIIMLLLVIFASYKFVVYKYDEYLAKNLYEQMKNIDAKLDSLQQEVPIIRAEKQANSDLISQFNSLTVSNFSTQKLQFINKINAITYESTIQLELLAIAESTTNSNYKIHHGLMRNLLKQLKVNYNQKIINFTDELKQLNDNVRDLNQSVSGLSSDSIRDLELARLKFLSKKISSTLVSLKGSLLDEIFDNIMINSNIKEYNPEPLEHK